MFDFSPYPGDPDLASAQRPRAAVRDTESASYTPAGGTVTAGFWFGAPTECGPYPGRRRRARRPSR